MVRLVAARYVRHRSKSGLPRFVVASQVPLFHGGALRFVDMVAVDSHVDAVFNEGLGRYERLSPPVHGFEVKVSRSDWLRELRTGGLKSEAWRSVCHYWWVVAPPGVVREGELPDGWGLLVGSERLRAVVKPVRVRGENSR